MKMRSYGKTVIYAAAFLMLAVLAVAQAPATSKTAKPRDAASGQASGRDVQTGISTGRRQYQPISTREASAAPTNPEATTSVQTAREASSGMATGRREAASGQASGREAQSGMATGRRQYQPLPIRDASAAPTSPEATNSVQTAREASSGMATGRKSGSVIAADFDYKNAKNSGHATEKLDVAPEGTGNAKPSPVSSNPMYKDGGNVGENPLYQGKDKTAAAPKPTATGHDVVEYKDGEDGTMRYRPGNNKTAKTTGKGNGTAPPPTR